MAGCFPGGSFFFFLTPFFCFSWGKGSFVFLDPLPFFLTLSLFCFPGNVLYFWLYYSERPFKIIVLFVVFSMFPRISFRDCLVCFF